MRSSARSLKRSPLEVGFERTALVPGTEYVASDSAGASCKDEKRAYNTAHHHRASLPNAIDR